VHRGKTARASGCDLAQRNVVLPYESPGTFDLGRGIGFPAPFSLQNASGRGTREQI